MSQQSVIAAPKISGLCRLLLSELEFRDVQRHVLLSEFMECADDTALDPCHLFERERHGGLHSTKALIWTVRI